MKTILSYLFIFWTLISNSTAVPLTNLRSSSVLGYAQQNQISSIEELLGQIDSSQLKHWYLVYGGRGLADASFENPRILLINSDDKGYSVMGFNGDPSQKKFQSLEFMEFDSESATFKFSELTTPLLKQSTIVYNPAECTRCHSKESPHPIWDSYRYWPGVAKSSTLFGETWIPGEDILLEPFYNKKPGHPRYQFLPGNHSNIFALVNDQNENIDRLFLKSNEERITRVVAQQLVDSPRAWRFRISLYIALRGGCGIPKETHEALKNKTSWNKLSDDTDKRYWKSVDRRLTAIEKFLGIKISDTPPVPANDIVVTLRWLLENNGISMEDWSLEFPRDSYVLRHSSQSSINFLRPALMKRLVSIMSDEDQKAIEAYDASSPNLSSKDCSILEAANARALSQ